MSDISGVTDVDVDEEEIDRDPVFAEINKHMVTLLELVKAHPKYAMACFFSREHDSNEDVLTYSGMCGQTDLIIDAMYVDFKNLVRRGHNDLVHQIIDMIYHLEQEMIENSEIEEEEDEGDEEVTADSKFMKELVSKTIH